MPVSASADASACAARTPAKVHQDVLGWSWFPDGQGWCRSSPAGVVQRWEVGVNEGTHLLHIGNGQASLAEAAPVLRRLEARSAENANCRGAPRSRLFVHRNWLVRRGDLDCGRFGGDGFTIHAGAYAAAPSAIPALLSSPVGERQGGIVVITGGPYLGVIGGVAASGLVPYLLNQHAGHASISMPAYIGTDAGRYGTGDLARAEVEIDTVLRHESRAGKPLCVIAMSLGGFAVAPLVANHPRARFLLAAPLASTAEDYVRRAERAGTPMPPRVLDEFGASAPRTVTLPADRALLDYFGPARTQTLAERLAPAARRPNWEILYSAADPVIGVDHLARLPARLGAVRMTRVARAGHGVEDPFNFPAYQPALASFLDRCLGGEAA